MKLIVMTLMRQYLRLDDIACLENGGFWDLITLLVLRRQCLRLDEDAF